MRSDSSSQPLRPRTVSADQIDVSALDMSALRVVARLKERGHEAYLVGGCVRDLLIGRRPKDFDVATSAHPRQVKSLFGNGRIIGRRFKLVHINYAGKIIETATFRREPAHREGEMLDLEPELVELEGQVASELPPAAPASPKKPKSADLDSLLITEDNEYGTAQEDALRRDFTVNALFYDPKRHEIIDWVGGLEDLQHGVLRTIGDPDIRLAEDPVRILRAIKFATRLGLRIDDATWLAMCRHAPRLARSAPPRVLEEILRLLRSGSALGAFRMLRACDALGVILPAVDEYLGDKDDPHAAARGETFWRLLEALDNEVHQGGEPATAVLVALLFLRIVERECDPDTRLASGPVPELGVVAAEVLEPVALRTRLPRKDVARARRLLVMQRRFHQTPSKRFRPLVFAAAEDFEEALLLFKLRVAARGQGWDIYEGWRERRLQALEAAPEAVASERKKARRRRRRRRSGPAGRAGSASN
jgi:poly(A) polymerase